jgi:hypothetical protein
MLFINAVEFMLMGNNGDSVAEVEKPLVALFDNLTYISFSWDHRWLFTDRKNERKGERESKTE